MRGSNAKDRHAESKSDASKEALGGTLGNSMDTIQVLRQETEWTTAESTKHADVRGSGVYNLNHYETRKGKVIVKQEDEK